MSSGTDVFRKKHRILTDDESRSVEALKTKAEEIHGLIGLVNGTTMNSRETALAKTKLEEAVFWAVKAVTG